jgi:hypothetical protein
MMRIEETEMRSPFPGMNPYLEHPTLFHEVHTDLIVALQLYLAPLVRPRYRVAVEQRTFLALLPPDDMVGLPDLSVIRETSPVYATAVPPTTCPETPLSVEVPSPQEYRERFLQVRDVASGAVITVVEILSPANKRSGEGRRQYEAKRLRVLGSLTHLVEMDLVRGGEPMPVRVQGSVPSSHYRILASRSNHRPRADLYAFSVRDPIPTFPLPLQPGDNEPIVDLGALLRELYERAGYDLAVNYRQDPVPPLAPDDAVWADNLLRQAGLR